MVLVSLSDLFHYIAHEVHPCCHKWQNYLPFCGWIAFHYMYIYHPCGSADEESACNAGDLGSIPGLVRSLGEGNSYPLWCSGLENSMDRGACKATVHGVAKSRTWLSDFHFTSLAVDYFRASLVAQMVKNSPAMQEIWVQSLGQEDPLKKEMAIHSSILIGESLGQGSLVGCSPWGHKELHMTKWLTHKQLNY